MTVRTIDEIFRDFVTDGVPASGPFNPHKPDIRDTLKALTEGSQNFPDNRVIRLNNANEGTGNNIVVTASVEIPVAAFQVLYILNVTQENTGPVTVSGAISRDLVTNTSAPVPVGYLKPGMAVLCIDTGTTLRMLSYGDERILVEEAESILAETTAIKNQTSVIRDEAEAARDVAAGYASDAVSQGNVPIYSAVEAIPSLAIPVGISAFRVNGWSVAGDGYTALFKEVSSQPSHSRWVRDVSGRYFENTRPVFFILATGQSNIAISRSKQWAPRKNIWRWNNADAVDGSTGNQFVQVSASNVQVSSVFADSLARENPGMDFYILNVGFGGREINHWLPGASAPDVYANITANIAGALTAAGVTKVNQMLWWQGEADYFTSTLPLYEAKFEQLIARFQTESWFDQSSPIFIFGTANAAQGGHANYDLINLILQRCGSNDPTRRQFFYTSMLPPDFWEDNLHPNADGVYLVAQMAAHQFLGRAGKFGYGMTVNPADGSVSIGKTLFSRSMLTVSRNDAYNRDLGSPSLLHLIPGNADINSRFLHEAFSTSVQWSARRANGTLSLPQSLKSNDVLLDLTTAGYNGSSYTSLTGGLQVRASSDWTSSSTPTNVRILVVPAGSTVQATAARFNENLDAIFTRSVIFKPPSEPVLEENGQVSIGRDSDTTLVFRVRGTDGVIRSATITVS
ncbi:sialate O-acetylesterase [Ochrobactrum intermedium]|nr:sialate O-acetylesterase [Ochrobactrum sp. MC-1LL]NKE77860.1 sialate O-acetylesterase [Ochrobactrum sp. MC-1LL]